MIRDDSRIASILFKHWELQHAATEARCMSFFSSFLLFRSSSNTVRACSKGSREAGDMEPQPPSVRSFFKELLPHIPRDVWQPQGLRKNRTQHQAKALYKWYKYCICKFICMGMRLNHINEIYWNLYIDLCERISICLSIYLSICLAV